MMKHMEEVFNLAICKFFEWVFCEKSFSSSKSCTFACPTMVSYHL